MSKQPVRFTVAVANDVPTYSTGDQPIPGIIHLTKDYSAVFKQLDKETGTQLTSYLEGTFETSPASDVWALVWPELQGGEGEEFNKLMAVLLAVEINANDLAGQLKKEQAAATKAGEQNPLAPYISTVAKHWEAIDKAAEETAAEEAKAKAAEKKTETVPPVAPKNVPAKPAAETAAADGLLGILTNLKTQADAGVATDAAIDEAIAALQRAKSSNAVTGQAGFATVQLVIQQLEAAGITLPEGVGTPSLEATNAQ